MTFDILAAATILGSIIAFHQFSTRNLYPGKLIFVEHVSIELFNSVIRRFPEVKVAYKNRPIRTNLVLLVGSIINRGRIDVQPFPGEDKLQLRVPEGFKWVTARVVRASPGLKVSIVARADRLIFETGLLKKGDVFQFEAICEADVDFEPGLLLPLMMRFYHRLPQTGRIRNLAIVDRSDIQRINERTQGFQRALPIITLVIVGTAALSFMLGQQHLRFSYAEEGKAPAVVRVFPTSDSTVRIVSMDGSIRKNLTLGDFQDRIEGPPIVIRETFLFTLAQQTSGFKYVLMVVFFQVVIAGVFAARWNRTMRKIAESTVVRRGA